MTNLYKIEELKSIIKIKSTNNIGEDEVFDYLRIIAIHDKKEEKLAKNILFFPITLNDEYCSNAWIIKPILLGEKVNEIIAVNPEYTYVLEPQMVANLVNKNIRYIEVDSIDSAIESLYLYVMKRNKAKTIAVTGSTGKTTTIGLLEHIIESKYKVLRIYSKRITPIILKAYIINLLTEEYDYIVLEMSLYYWDHVKTLANILPPYISAIINLDNAHLGNDGMIRREDLAISKGQIFSNAKIGYINDNNDVLRRFNLNNHILYLDNEVVCNTNCEIRKINSNLIKVLNNTFVINDTVIEPYMLSELSQVQIALGYNIGLDLGLTHEEICNQIGTYKPVENRINKQQFMDRTIILDGDVTNAARIRSLANSLYKKKVLVIRKFGSSENYVDCVDVIKEFAKFDQVYLFEDVDYFQDLVNHPKVCVVNNHKFIKNIDNDVMIIYHYSAYFRSYEKFEEHNLETIDRIKYPILYRNKVGV